jgi:hypothetical protein
MFVKTHITKCFINDVYVNQQKVWLIQTLLVIILLVYNEHINIFKNIPKESARESDRGIRLLLKLKSKPKLDM